jgi:hypothetical protein
MPSAPITSESLLISNRGWAFAHTQPSTTFGTDRHGQIVSRPVSVKLLDQSVQPVFLGTEATLGYFAPGTMLITKPGRSLSASTLVEYGDLTDVWFENVVRLPGDGAYLDSDRLVEALIKSAPFVSEERLARRCNSRDNEALRTLLSPICKFYDVSNELFCILDRRALQSNPETKWPFVMNLLSVLCGDTEDDALMFGADDPALALWYCSGLIASKKQYLITYDSLQHSLFATVRRITDQQSPFKNARCAYLESLAQRCVEIRWDDGSWSPIINGFLLKGT